MQENKKEEEEHFTNMVYNVLIYFYLYYSRIHLVLKGKIQHISYS